MGGQNSAAAAAEYDENEKKLKRQHTEEARSHSIGGNKSDAIAHGRDVASSTSGSDLGQQLESSKAYGGVKVPTARVTVIHGLDRPLFHIDLTSALQSAIANVEMRGEGGVAKGVGTEGV